MSVEGMDLLDQLSVLSSDVGRDEVQELREALRASARMRAQVLDAKKDHAKLVKYQAAAQESAKEVEKLRQQLQGKDIAARDLTYELKKLRREHEQLQDKYRTTETTTRSSLDGLKTALMGVEETVEHRHQQVKVGAANLLQLLQTLAQHTMNGYHSGPSHVAVQLLKALEDGLKNISNFGAEGTVTTHKQSLAAGAPLRSYAALAEHKAPPLQPVGVADASVTRNGTGTHIPEELTELVRRLEEENTSLQDNVSQLTAQVVHLQREASLASLIPQYRLCVVRARAQTQACRERLQAEQESSELLKEKLSTAHAQLREAVEQQKVANARLVPRELSDARLSTALKHPRRPAHHALHLSTHTTNEVHAESEGISVSEHGAAARVWTGAESSSSGHRGTEHKSKHAHTQMSLDEEDVQRDICVLDEEILRLRSRLEEAALTHTNEILEEVLNSHTRRTQLRGADR